MEKIIAVLQDLTTYARINEYECSRAVLDGRDEEARIFAKNADTFRQGFNKILENYLKEQEQEK